MLTIELRTTDLKEILELWDTDKEKLKLKLLDDYDDLAKEYRRQCKIYTQESHKGAIIFNKYRTFTSINYQAELDIDERIRGKVKFTKDFKENIKIALRVIEGTHYDILSTNAYQLKEIIKLKTQEIEEILNMLGIKVPYDNDFSLKTDQWRHEDLMEVNNFDENI